MVRPTLLVVSALVLVLCASVSTSANAQSCDPKQAATKYPEYAGKTVKVGASPTFPPFTYTDPKKPENLIGLEAEITDGIMAWSGLKYEYSLGAWSGLIPSLVSGSIDVAIGNVVYRPDRGQQVDFVVFMRGGQSVIVQKGNPKKISHGDDLCGTTGSSVIAGASALEIDRQSKACVAGGKAAINFQPATDQDAAYRQLLNGRVDFVEDGTTSAAARLAAVPDYELAYSVTTDQVAGPIVSKGNATMIRIVDEGMEELQRDGKLKALMDKYGLPEDLLMPVEVRK